MQHFPTMLRSAPRPSRAHAIRLGRRTFLAAERLDMSALADALGINRVTLYRWVGSRDQLLVEVVWSLAERALQEADRRAGGRGPGRVVAVLTGFLDLVIASP